MLLPTSGIELAVQLPTHLALLDHAVPPSLALYHDSAPSSFTLAAAELTGDDVTAFADTVQETFVSALKGKFIGVVVGNILAALAFGAITYAFQNAIAEVFRENVRDGTITVARRRRAFKESCCLWPFSC